MDRRPVIGFETDAETGVLLKNDRKTDGSKQIQNSESLRRYYGRGDLFQRMLSRLILPIPESACMSRISVSGLFSLRSAASASTQISGPARSSLARGPRIRQIRLSGSPVRSAVPLPIGFPRASFRHNLRFSVGDRRHISGRTNRICQTKSLRRRRDGICGKQTAPARGSFQAPASALKRYDTLLYTPAALRSSVKPCLKAIFSHFPPARAEKRTRSVTIRGESCPMLSSVLLSRSPGSSRAIETLHWITFLLSFAF